MDLITKKITQLTRGNFLNQRPCIGPDNKKIIFVTTRQKQYRLWTTSTDLNSEEKPLSYTGYGYRPWFNLDGKSIFFHTWLNGRERVCQLALNSKIPIPLANDTLYKSRGAFIDWEGKFLFVHGQAAPDAKWHIWRIPLNGKRMSRLTPPGFSHATHATQAKNKIVAFDVVSIGSH